MGVLGGVAFIWGFGGGRVSLLLDGWMGVRWMELGVWEILLLLFVVVVGVTYHRR